MPTYCLLGLTTKFCWLSQIVTFNTWIQFQNRIIHSFKDTARCLPIAYLHGLTFRGPLEHCPKVLNPKFHSVLLKNKKDINFSMEMGGLRPLWGGGGDSSNRTASSLALLVEVVLLFTLAVQPLTVSRLRWTSESEVWRKKRFLLAVERYGWSAECQIWPHLLPCRLPSSLTLPVLAFLEVSRSYKGTLASRPEMWSTLDSETWRGVFPLQPPLCFRSGWPSLEHPIGHSGDSQNGS